MTNSNLHSRGCKSDKSKVASTRHLTRIIVYLSENETGGGNKMRQALGLHNDHLRDAINFLLNYKIIFIANHRYGVAQYSLNQLFKKNER